MGEFETRSTEEVLFTSGGVRLVIGPDRCRMERKAATGRWSYEHGFATKELAAITQLYVDLSAAAKATMNEITRLLERADNGE